MFPGTNLTFKHGPYIVCMVEARYIPVASLLHLV